MLPLMVQVLQPAQLNCIFKQKVILIKRGMLIMPLFMIDILQQPFVSNSQGVKRRKQ